jgi:multidrug efflux pump
VLVLNPPPIRGLSTAGGFTFVLQNRISSDPLQLSQVLQDLLSEARKRPEIGFVYSGFDPRIPQIEFQVDRDKVKSLGIPLNDVFFALQTFLGSYYVNDFNLFGRTYRVQAQADGAQRSRPDDVNRFYVRSDGGTMVPLSTLVTSRPINGPQYFERYNVYSSATINGSNAPGYSSGQAIAAMESVAREVLPAGFSYAWSGLAYEEKKSGSTSALAFVFGLIIVFLVLSAQYESWTLPGAVMTAVPFGVLGALTANWLRGLQNDVYFQIGLLVLIGLGAKNAVLRVTAAVELRQQGKSIMDATIEAGEQRLRPIIMTSLAFAFGVLPLAIALGAGANARHSIGTGIIGGMIGETTLAMLYVPLLFYIFDRLAERRSAGRAGGEARAGRGGSPPATAPRARPDER